MNYLFLYLCVICVSLGGLLAGYDTGVISGALLYINQSFEINSFQTGLIVGSVSLGAIIGAVVNGYLADLLGRKKIIIIVAILFILSSVICSVAQNPLQLIIARFMLGIGVGVVAFACPLYLSEIAPKEKRGQMVSFYQLAITFGILFSYLANYFCSFLDFNWRAMFFVGVFPAIILLLGMMLQKDTARWYVMKGKINDARDVLKKINSACDVETEIDEISKTLVKHDTKFNKKLVMPFIIGIGIMFAQIVTGINAIIYYAPVIFKNLGFSSNEQVLLFTIFIGVINFFMTFVAIAFVDKIGRKPLLYIGLSGMMISLIVLSLAHSLDLTYIKYLAVIFCAAYIVFFSMSLGPVALLLNSEIFPLEYRARAMSIVIVANYLFNFVVTSLFPISLDKLGGSATFLIFAFICVISLLFIYFVVPETKGVSLEKISEKWM